ncbi:MAG: nucleotidyltransferase domain-containing protein [Desulfobulbaceae bacterium]|nr:nucleotidyltransferase domain-containing protein [Desulfobulbaceae bacterium]
MKIVFDLEKAREGIIRWAELNKHITKVYIFGSRVSGCSKKTGLPVRPDSDLDVAVEFDKFDGDENLLTTWVGEADTWRKELAEQLGLSGEIELDLEWHHPMETPSVHQYLQDGSLLIYEREAGEQNLSTGRCFL